MAVGAAKPAQLNQSNSQTSDVEPVFGFIE
jgi:hypothetical protein